jgi:HAD superfamily hydrolase (TIGR01484 family)
MQDLSQWPEAARRRIVGVFTDIDDTLTTQGAITGDALQALSDLKAAGLYVIPITGRPVGWCVPFMDNTTRDAWPVDAMVAENGAVALQRPSNLRGQLSKLYQQDLATRAHNHARMQEVAAKVRAMVPGILVSGDNDGRETDIAFDYAEHAQLPDATVQAILDLLRQEGMVTTVSSIHIHGCFGQFDKWLGACWIAKQLLQRDLTAELDRWVFVGDSGNDQAMFKHFEHSVGVANIARFVPQLSHLPTYVTQCERGAGFAEVAQALLEARGSF